MKKRLLALGMAIFLAAVPTALVHAETPDGEIPNDPENNEIVVEETNQNAETDNRPFISLGKDLSAEQRAYVLSEMGVTEEQLSDYKVIYVSNDMEHSYLDSYIDPSIIGSYSLSCVMVKPNNEGTGIRVTTKNINYCTISMYKNALLTAGVKNADVLVVGPFPISGTAALIGAWKAYEEMVGTELNDIAKDTALEEMIVTGEITDNVSDEDKEAVSELIDYIKVEVIANDLTDSEEIKKVIEKAEQEFDIALASEQKEALLGVMQKISGLDIDPATLLEQAGDLYDKYGSTVLAEAKDAINGILTEDVKKSLWDSIKGFFKTLFDAVKDYVVK